MIRTSIKYFLSENLLLSNFFCCQYGSGWCIGFGRQMKRITAMQFSCPTCVSKAIKKNGYTRHGKQNHRCLDCGRQFSLEPSDQQESPSHSKQEKSQISCQVIG